MLSLIAAAVLAVDVVTKVLAVAELEGREPVELFGGLVHLVLVRNPGAAWSLATGYTWVLSLIAITVVIVLIRVARRLRSTGWAIALGLVLGGALGNLVDRIFRSPGPLRGHVVDMVSLLRPDGTFFPVFNAADSAVCCGGVLLVLLALTGRELDGTRSPTRRSRDGGGDGADSADSADSDDGPPDDTPRTGDTTPARHADGGPERSTADTSGSDSSGSGGSDSSSGGSGD
ncbi:signal peptidase II [Pseudonocardia sp. S2-4]|uniref:Lipoprotein signal peptidase n=1 Tax=Pseudonocardia humida TaxID=2800819 RepID=A0ABT0ZYU6_9PSEU|nr:signal peptidase II [Pseudonocardia humida]